VSYSIKTYRVRFVAEKEQEPFKSKARSSEQAARLARMIYSTLDADREHFVVICLNQKNLVEGFKVVSSGNLTGSSVNSREVYHAAIVFRAAALIFVHNHPSGDPSPSEMDINETCRLKKIGDLFDIRVLDHVILGRDAYFSFTDEGLL
jgi:DNA repair protein RadC